VHFKHRPCIGQPARQTRTASRPGNAVSVEWRVPGSCSRWAKQQPTARAVPLTVRSAVGLPHKLTSEHLLFADWSPSGARFANSSQYSTESQLAPCVQSLPERFDKFQTNNFSVKVMVKRLQDAPAKLSAASGIPRVLRCNPDVTARQITTWPTNPVPISKGYPRGRRRVRYVSGDDLADMPTGDPLRADATPPTQPKACRWCYLTFYV
jgi:hypothetical protein